MAQRERIEIDTGGGGRLEDGPASGREDLVGAAAR